MKAAFTLCLMLIALIAPAQDYVMASPEDIKAKFEEEGREVHLDTTPAGNKVYVVDKDYALLMYMFDEQFKYCEMYGIAPYTEEFQNMLIEMFNEKYVVLSRKKWASYEKEYVTIIEFVKDDEFGVFWFTIERD